MEDDALLKALTRYDRTDETKPGPRLEALETLIEQIGKQVIALAKRKKELVAGSAPPDPELPLMGYIVLSTDGQPAVEVRDDMEFVVPELCMAMPATLAAAGRATVTMASYPTAIDFALDDGEVRVSNAEDVEWAPLRDMLTQRLGA